MPLDDRELVLVGERAQAGRERRRQRRLAVDDDGLGFDLARVVQRDAGDAEQQHRHQAQGRADPVPLVQLFEPHRATGAGEAGRGNRRLAG